MSISFIIYSYTQGEWQTASEAMTSETAVLIEPPEGAVTRVNTKPQCNSTPFGIKMAWIYKCVCVYMLCIYIYWIYLMYIFFISDSQWWTWAAADAASRLLLSSAHPSAGVTLPADCSRTVAAMHGRISVRETHQALLSERQLHIHSLILNKTNGQD